MIIINNLENPIICSLIALILFGCNLLLPSNDCSLRWFLLSATMWALRTLTEVKMVDKQPSEPSPTELP